MRKPILIALVALPTSLAIPPSALAAEPSPISRQPLLPSRADIVFEENAQRELKGAAEALAEMAALEELVTKELDKAKQEKDLVSRIFLNKKQEQLAALKSGLTHRASLLKQAYDNRSGGFSLVLGGMQTLYERFRELKSELEKYLNSKQSRSTSPSSTDDSEMELMPSPLLPPGGGGGLPLGPPDGPSPR